MVIKRFLAYLAPIAGLVAGLALAAFNTSIAYAESIDMGFNPGVYAPEENRPVRAIVVQPDGKILVGGKFSMLGGQPRQNMGRLNANGSLDTSFDPGTNDIIYAIALQPDGKIFVGGSFTTLAGQPCQFIGRLNADGSLDACFNSGTVDGLGIQTIIVQPDGKILVGGWFDTLAGQPRQNIGRINLDGSLDATFLPENQGTFEAMILQPDGKIVVGGYGTPFVAYRLNEDGSRDTSFQAPEASTSQLFMWVMSVALQADGKILVGGNFTELDGQPWNGIARLNQDGSLDTGFTPNANNPVKVISVQADGKILAGGDFTSLGGQARLHIGRLNTDGSLDTSFCHDADGWVYELALQPDGGILVGGKFTTLGGQPRENIGRITPTADPNPGPNLTVELTPNGDVCKNILVTNNGSEPVDWVATFEFSKPVSNLWNAIWSQNGNTVIIEGVEWNNILQPGETTHSIGFCANRTGGGTTLIPPSGVTVTVTTESDWGTGYCANITVTNNASVPVDWRVTFPVIGKVNNLWNAVWSQNGNQVTAEGVSWNNILKPGESSHSIGFCANK